MWFKVSWLLMILVMGVNSYRFGGSVGVSSHAVAAGSTSAVITQDEKTGDFKVTNSKQNTFTDWSGSAGAGGYIGQPQPKYNPNGDISGIGRGAAIDAHFRRSGSGEFVANGNGPYNKNVVSSEKSSDTIKAGFTGTQSQVEADRISNFGNRAGNMPSYGSSNGGFYGSTYGNNNGPRYSSP